MSSKFQTALLIGIAFVVVMLYMRRPEKQIPIVQDIEVTQPEERSITVSSEGKVTTNLDEVEFLIIMDTEAKELADAKLASEESLFKATTILSTHGVEEKDIIIGDTLIRVKTGYTTVNPKVVGYIVYQSVKVTLRHLDQLMPLFAELQETQLFEIESIVFSISELEGYRERALQLAIQNANAKAKAIAREAGQEVGSVITIQAVNSNYSSAQYYRSFETLDSFFGEGTNRWEKPLWIFEITIAADVVVTFELK